MPAEVLPAVDELSSELDRAADLRPLYKEEIARALDLICRDSRYNPNRYLQETMVPHGGE